MALPVLNTKRKMPVLNTKRKNSKGTWYSPMSLGCITRCIKTGEESMTIKLLSTLFALVGLVIWSPSARAHCQVPCGIYHDHARVLEMQEDLTTITKAVAHIEKLAAKKDAQSKNQLVRWINTKEHHAEKIMRTIADYFMAQKIKPVTAGAKAKAAYLEQLMRHHKVMVAAMHCKQTAGKKAIEELSRALAGIQRYWPHGH